MKLGLIIPARNEEKTLQKTLDHINNQTQKPDEIIIINDNSNDNTKNIAIKSGYKIIDFPYKHNSWLSHSHLANVFNLGFKELSFDNDYIMILGADHLLPKTYIETIIYRMDNDKQIVITSGKIENEWSVSPRGSGRIIRNSFWKKIGSCYPVNWGFESYPLYKALQLGYKIEHYADIQTYVQRKTSLTYSPKTYYRRGKGMQALGYTKFYAIGRCLVIGKRHGIKCGLQMYKGYRSDHVMPYEKDLQEFIRNTHIIRGQQIKRLTQYLFHYPK